MDVLAARSGWLAGHGVPGLATLLVLATASAAAQDTGFARNDLAVARRADARARMELSASSVPLFDSTDGATRSTRLDMIWLPPRRPSLGLALGLTGTDGIGFRPPGSPTGPALDLGFHWRYDDAYRVDVSAWRRMTPPDPNALGLVSQVNYGARVEMQVSAVPGSSNFRADRSFLGFQLESGARIGVRRYAGRPMFYYRTSF
jgi:hypothetical protein